MTVVRGLEVPESWSTVPLWSLARRVSEKGHPALPLLSVYRDHGVVRREDREDNHNQASEDLGAYQRVMPGDIVLNKMKTWQGSLGVSAWEGIVSPAYFVCRQRTDRALPKFLHYLLRSRPYIATYAALSKGIRPGQWDLPWDEFRSLPVLLPSLEEQRRISDFLDDQVALLDQAVALRQRQMDLLHERFQSQVDVLSDPAPDKRDSAAMVKAGLVLRILSGFAFPSDEFSAAEGHRLLRGVNVGVREINWDQTVHWTRDVEPVVSRFSLRAGDTVMGMDRPWIGAGLRIAQLKDGDVPCLLLQRVAALRPSKHLDPDYMFWVYQARRFRYEIEGELTGLSVPHLSGEQIASYRFPLPDLSTQRALATNITRAFHALERTGRLLSRSTALLSERKQALITAAVTGQFDVSAARKVSVA